MVPGISPTSLTSVYMLAATNTTHDARAHAIAPRCCRMPDNAFLYGFTPAHFRQQPRARRAALPWLASMIGLLNNACIQCTYFCITIPGHANDAPILPLYSAIFTAFHECAKVTT